MRADTDIAIESADIVILGNDLNAVLTAQTISRRSYRRTRQNVGLAFTFNGIGVSLAATGLVYPVLGHGGDGAQPHHHLPQLQWWTPIAALRCDPQRRGTCRPTMSRSP